MSSCTLLGRKRVRPTAVSSCAVAFAGLVGASLLASTASAETRGYAISLIHTATYADKGNCPQGGNGSTTEIHERILMAQGLTKEQADKVLTSGGGFAAADDAGAKDANAKDANAKQDGGGAVARAR